MIAKLRFLPMMCLAAAACGAEPVSDRCKSNTDCKQSFYCETATGACLCRTNDACDAGQYCNSYGSCQERPACLGNQDCEPGEICNSADRSGGKCIPATTCGSSAHCALNQYCKVDPTKPHEPGTCTPGCKSTGDCQLGYICAAGADAELARCVAGGTAADCTICPASPDPDASYCDYGEICTNDGICAAHPTGASLCEDCSSSNRCPGDLICLIDQETQETNYCAPSCRNDSNCPSGYSGCGGLVMVMQECTSQSQCDNGGRCLGRTESNRGYCECLGADDCGVYDGICQNVGLSSMCAVALCRTNTDCARYGLTCMDQTTGLCFFGMCQNGAGSCSVAADCMCVNHECFLGGAYCSSGADCAPGLCAKTCSSDQECMCLNGRCALTDLPCVANDDCMLSCEEGSCVTNAKACGKEAGMSCDELLADPAICRQL